MPSGRGCEGHLLGLSALAKLPPPEVTRNLRATFFRVCTSGRADGKSEQVSLQKEQVLPAYPAVLTASHL